MFDTQKLIEPIEKPYTYDHFYETDAVRGILTKIGSLNLDAKIPILINNLPEEIEISKQQEKALKRHLKAEELEFYLREGRIHRP